MLKKNVFIELRIEPEGDHTMKRHYFNACGNQIATLMLLFVMVATPTWADVLVIGSSKKKATIEGYDGRNILYYDFDSHKNEQASRMSVKAFALDNPRKAEIVLMGKPKPQKMLMHGYRDGKFVFADGEKRVEIHAMKVDKITLEKAQMFAKQPQAAPEPVQKLSDADIQKALSRPDITPEQKALLKEHQANAKEYHQFVAESGKLVSQMDSLTGANRIAALEQLRHRKEAEQPLKNKMIASQNAVLQKMPDILSVPAQDMAVVNNPPESSETITMTMPPIGENEILIIDTSVFKQLGELNETQKTAIANYDAAVGAYQNALGAPSDVVHAAQGELTVAQKKLFQAFPNVRIQ
jgi:hypothetical protein